LVFQFLDRGELGKAAQVSRRWKDLAYDKSLLIEKIKKGCFYCIRCKAHLGRDEDVIPEVCWKIDATNQVQRVRLDHQLAYRVKQLDHARIGKIEKADFPRGQFNVALVSCSECEQTLGVKYVDALDGQNAEFVGSFIVKKKHLYFPAENMKNRISLACRKCSSPVGLQEDIMDNKYQLGGGQASLVSQLVNMNTDTPVDVHYTSGSYRVCNIFCGSCNHNLGVKYIHASDARNAFKIGTFLIENSKYEVVFPVTQYQDAKQKSLFTNLLRFLRRSI